VIFSHGWDANNKRMKQKIKLHHLSVTNSKHRSRILLGVSDIAKSLSLSLSMTWWLKAILLGNLAKTQYQAKAFWFLSLYSLCLFSDWNFTPTASHDCFFHFSSHLHFTPPIFLLLWLLLALISFGCFFFFVFSHNISRALIFTFVGYFESHILFTS
jgi:hypothetical protein